MKIFYIAVFAILFANKSFAQKKIFPPESFVKNFQRSFNVPIEFITDTCATEIYFLRLYVDDYGKVAGIWFSDNAPATFQSELSRIKQKFDIQAIELYCKGKDYKNLNFLFPVFILNKAFEPCRNSHNFDIRNRQLTKFNGENLSGDLYLGDPINITVDVVVS